MKRAVLVLTICVCALAQQRKDGLYAVFETSRGTFTARLLEKYAPKTVENFVALANGTKPTYDLETKTMVTRRLYDNITFHRVVPGEMIQSGDPTGLGTHPCGVKLKDEILPGLRFDTGGKLAMANTGQPDSGGCQWFVTVDAVRPWDGQYTIFGEVVEGMSVVSKINHEKVRGDKPVDPVKLIKVTIERVGPEPVQKSRKK